MMTFKELIAENLDLKARLSRALNPEAPQYTEEEIEAMDYQNQHEALS